MWVITSDGGRAINLNYVKRIEASGSGDKKTLTAYVETREGPEGSVLLGSDLPEEVVTLALQRLSKGEGIDLRSKEPPGIAFVE